MTDIEDLFFEFPELKFDVDELYLSDLEVFHLTFGTDGFSEGPDLVELGFMTKTFDKVSDPNDPDSRRYTFFDLLRLETIRVSNSFALRDFILKNDLVADLVVEFRLVWSSGSEPEIFNATQLEDSLASILAETNHPASLKETSTNLTAVLVAAAQRCILVVDDLLIKKSGNSGLFANRTQQKLTHSAKVHLKYRNGASD